MNKKRNCPEETILKAVVLGEVNEPLLDYYLDHIENCDRCTEIIDKSSWPQLEFQELISKSRLSKSDLKPDDFTVDKAWLEAVKKNFPAADFVPAGNPNNALGLPEVIGNFRLTNLIGDGATSIVYQAMDISLHRQVALKILHPEFVGNPELQESIMSEARAIASLSHENIVPIFHVEKFENNPILVFPLLPGSTLQKALQEKQFSVEESLQIIRDIARALAFIHSRGILHRDIKPSNIWLGQREDGGLSARLFDFGFVGLQQNRSGTSGYMAPEQINHLPNSSATDMFALGSLMFQLFKGKKTPQKIQNLIEQLLASDPAARPDANQVIKILENRQRPGRKAVLIGAGMVLGLLVLFGVLRFRGQSVSAPAVLETPARPVENVVSKKLPAPLFMLEFDPKYANSLSPNGKWFVRQVKARELELVDVKIQSVVGKLSTKEDIVVVEINALGNLLAVLGQNREVNVFRVPDLQPLFQSGVPSETTKMLWVGKNSDILVLKNLGNLLSLMPDSKTGKYPPNASLLPLFGKNDKNKHQVSDFAGYPGSDLLLASTNGQSMLVWSFEKSAVVQMCQQSDRQKAPHLGWRDKDTYCLYQGRNMVETSVLPENTQKQSLLPKMVDLWDLPGSAEEVIWMDEKNLVYLTDWGEEPQIHQGRRGGRSPVAEFDSSGQSVYRLQSLGASGQFAAFCKFGKVLVFRYVAG